MLSPNPKELRVHLNTHSVILYRDSFQFGYLCLSETWLHTNSLPGYKTTGQDRGEHLECNHSR